MLRHVVWTNRTGRHNLPSHDQNDRDRPQMVNTMPAGPHMKALTISLLLSLLIFTNHLFGQIAATNKIARAEAIRIASHLTVGMRQADASEVLVRGGFQEVSAATSFHSCFQQYYPLADGCDLCLEYMPTLSSTNSMILRLRSSQLQQASINSNGVQIISIMLTNTP